MKKAEIRTEMRRLGLTVREATELIDSLYWKWATQWDRKPVTTELIGEHVRRFQRRQRGLGKPGQTHQKLVADLVASGAETTGFLRALTAAMSSLPFRDVRPDAFELDTFAARATAYEVVVHNRIDERKRLKYEQLRGAMLDRGWALEVVTITADGERGSLW